jgi:DNA repair protein RadD
VLFSYIAQSAAARGKRVCILVHRRELLNQAREKLNAPHGVIQSGYTPNPWQPVQVASIQTLVNRLHKHTFDLLIFDESHHCPSGSYRRIQDHYRDAHVLGVTATPCRLDGKGLDDCFESLIIGPSVANLTERGFLSPCEILSWDVIDTSGVGKQAGDYNVRQLNAVADQPKIIGNAIDHYREHADNLPAIAFCVSVDHAEHVAEQFRQAGYRAKRVDGAMPQAERDEAIKGLGLGRYHVITSCELISEGVDIPVVSCGILLRPTQSLSMHLQQIGRVLRPAPGKVKAVILDHSGNCVRHGSHLRDRVWTLKGVEKRQGPAVAVPVATQCPQCYRVFEGRGDCPFCGFVPEAQGRSLQEEVGNLVRFNEEAVRKAEEERAEAERKRREVWGAKTREDLERIAQERRYKRGWVEHMVKMLERFGRPLEAAAPTSTTEGTAVA